MNFDQLLVNFFGSDETADLPRTCCRRREPSADRIGLERDGGPRFALWCLAYVLGAALSPDVAFNDEAHRDAAHDFMDTVDREVEEEGCARKQVFDLPQRQRETARI